MKILGFFTFVSESANDKQLHVWTIFCMKCFIWHLRVRFLKTQDLVNPVTSYLGCFQARYSLKNVCFQNFSSPASQNTQARDSIFYAWISIFMIKFHTSINAVCKTWKKTEYSFKSFSQKTFLLQKYMLNKCDRPKLICLIIKCCYSVRAVLEIF